MTARSLMVGPWMPDLPSHWDTVALRRLVQVRNGADYKLVEAESGGYPVYGSGGEFRRANDYLYDGPSVLFGRKGTIDKPLLVTGRFWTVDTMFYTDIGPRLDPRFLHYYAVTMPFAFYQTSTALPSMTQDDLGGHILPLPPLDEQRTIADYLDRETAQIDTLIAKQEQLIATLRERRASAIDRQFEGLDACEKRLKLVATVQSGLTLSGEGAPELPTWPYLRVANVQTGRVDTSEITTVRLSEERAAEVMLQAGDVLMTEGGDIDKLGRGTVWDGHVSPMLHQNHVFAVRAGTHLDPAYLAWWLEGSRARLYFRLTAKKTTNLASTNKWILGNLPLPVPDLKQQRALTASLQTEVGAIERLVDNANRLINFSKERRSALITVSVTGQHDVTGR